MKLKLYGYKNCSTCKKALAFLKDRDLAFTEVDITTTPPTLAELRALAKSVGVRKLFNTSGQVYREMGLGDRLKTMAEDEALALLAANGRLVKRPFLVVDGEPFAAGFAADE